MDDDSLQKVVEEIEARDGFASTGPKSLRSWARRLKERGRGILAASWDIEAVAMGDPLTRGALQPIAKRLRSIAGGQPE